MKINKIIGILLILFLFTGCYALKDMIDRRYDFSYASLFRSREQLAELKDCLHTIRITYSVALEKDNIILTEFLTGRGVAISLDGETLIVLKHVLRAPYMITSDLSLKYKTRLKPVDIKYFLDDEGLVPLKILSSDTLDIGIAYGAKSRLKLRKLPCVVGNSDELQEGHALIYTRTPWMAATLMDRAIVSRLSAIEEWTKYLTIAPGTLDLHFILSEAIERGDSGDPVFALRDGRLELVGLLKGTGPTASLAIKINPAMEEITRLMGIVNDKKN